MMPSPAVAVAATELMSTTPAVVIACRLRARCAVFVVMAPSYPTMVGSNGDNPSVSRLNWGQLGMVVPGGPRRARMAILTWF